MKDSHDKIPETLEEELEKIRELDVKKMHQYIWQDYKRDISTKLEIIISFSWAFIFPILTILSVNFLKNNPPIDVLGFFIILICMGICLAILVTVEARRFRFRNFKFDKKVFQPHTTNLNFIYFLIIASLGGFAVFVTIGSSIFINPATPLELCALYIMVLLPICFLYMFSPRTYGAGRTRMIGLYLLLFLDNPEKYKSGVIIFIDELCRGLDDWMAEVLHLRIGNYEEFQTQLYIKAISNPIQFKKDITDQLNQAFFDALRNWKDFDNISIITSRISVISGKSIRFIPDTLLLRIKRKNMITTLISMIFLVIFNLIALISTIYGLIP